MNHPLSTIAGAENIFVSTPPGASGNFLMNLINGMLRGCRMVISDIGHCHYRSKLGIGMPTDRQWNSDSGMDQFVDETTFNYDMPAPRIGLTHSPNIPPILDRFPNSLVFYSLITPDDIEQIATNLLFKFYMNLDGNELIDNNTAWADLVRDTATYPILGYSLPEDPLQMTRGQVSDVIRLFSTIPKYKGYFLEPPSDDRICTIRYHKLVSGDPTLIDEMSRHLDVTPGRIDYINLYRYSRVQPMKDDLLQWFD